MKKISFFAITLTVITFVISHPSYAIYKWTDETGQAHISDTPKPIQVQQNEVNILSNSKEQTVRPTRNDQNSTGPDYRSINPATLQTPIVIQNSSPSLEMDRQFQINQMAAQRSLETALMPLATLISVLLLLGLIHFIIFILTLIDIMRSEFKNSTNKVLWVILILFLPLIGAVLYFFIGTQQKVEQESEDTELPRERPRELDM